MSGSTIVSALGSAGSIFASLLTAVAGASPYGLGAVGGIVLLTIVGGWIGWNKIVSYLNSSTDSRDQQNAGADAGNTSVDMANQAGAVRQGLDGLQAANPPTDPNAPKVKS
ncbi:MAG: hypothetical protein P4M08_14320 [Oligoflexia bacterium]|nr:hypothetical protein [Oligoflexia bacterium]